MFVSLFFILSWISSEFSYDRRNIDKPIILMVVLLIVSGALYLWLVLWFKPAPRGRFWPYGIFLVGLFARLSLFLSTPILEDDYYRYLWDGGMVAHGFNPYPYSPREVLGGGSAAVPGQLAELVKEARPIPERVNHPGLKTIYPPVAQFAFGLAHLLSPWSISGWRVVLLTADLVTLYLHFLLLRRLNLSLMGIVIYWWNPLLIKETYNSAHLDVILLPFILGALLFSIRRRYIPAAAALGLAVGVKLWPVFLLPAVLRPVFQRPKDFALPSLTFAFLSIVMILPFFLSGLNFSSGLLAYLGHWEMNDSLFLLLLWGLRSAVYLLDMEVGNVSLLTRIAAAGLFLAWNAWLLRKPEPNPQDLIFRFLLITAGLFLLLPVQFPWYYLWMLPLLALRPRVSLLLFTALLPLYYLRFYFEVRGWAEIFDHYFIWLQFAPVWFVLIWEWQKGKKGLTPREAV